MIEGAQGAESSLPTAALEVLGPQDERPFSDRHPMMDCTSPPHSPSPQTSVANPTGEWEGQPGVGVQVTSSEVPDAPCVI